MPTHLSELQKTIMRIALENRFNQYDFRADARHKDVLINFYGFDHHAPSPSSTSGSPHVFNKKDIGHRRYQAAAVAVVKSFRRLERKGFVKCIPNRGVRLTDAGIAKALRIASGGQRSNMI